MKISKGLLKRYGFKEDLEPIIKKECFKLDTDDFHVTVTEDWSNTVDRDWSCHIDNCDFQTILRCDIGNFEHLNMAIYLATNTLLRQVSYGG